MGLSAGTRLGPYEIVAPLGAGGMGVVYRARDTRLGREVALKLVPPGLLDDEGARKRFRQEALALSTLSHANIATLYEFDSDQGVEFLVMELVAGASLRGRVTAGPLPIRQVLAFGMQIVNGLAAAHGAGIVHRDLKPENLIVTPEGQIKILDFGVAKLTPPVDAAARTASFVTDPGAAVGTVPYMAPEQLRGEATDHRVDIYAAGAVLYEMATGHLPFEGRGMALAEAILTREPVPPEVLNPQVPAPLSQIILKALDKEPRRRYQSARELAVDLERLSEGATRTAPIGVFTRMRGWKSPLLVPIAIAMLLAGLWLGTRSKGGEATIDSIAVLPFENRSDDPDADYISDGITESINNSLTRLPNLRVIPHSVAVHYKGKTMEAQKAGDELHVNAVLTGRVVQRGDNLTISVELDDVRHGKQLWGEQYNRKLADLLAVQSDIARGVSQRVGSQLSAEDRKQLTKGSTDNPEAYQLYLKGKYYTNKYTKDGFGKGIDYFNQAIAVDPRYALAYSGLAYNYINQDDWFMPPREAGPKAKDAAEKALAIDESDADAHVSLAIETQWYEWNWAAAEREFKRAIELNPNNSEAHVFYAWFLASMGRKDEALAEAKRSQQADPLSSVANFSVGSVLLFTRQWDLAIEHLRSAKELDPTFWFDACFLGRAYEQKGRLPEAIAEYQRAVELATDNSEPLSSLGHAYALSGNRAEAQKTLDHLKELSAHTWVAPYNVAVIYAGLGEKDQAFAWLDRAYKDRSYYLAEYLPTDARLDNLRSDPRFTALLRKVGLEK